MFEDESVDSHDEVDAHRKDDCKGTIEPKHHNHSIFKPLTSGRYAILGNVDQNGAKADERGGDEQILSRVQKACSKGVWIDVEANANHDNIENKENHVQNKKDATNGEETVEAERD